VQHYKYRARDKRIRGVQQVHDERTPSLEEGARRAWAPAFVKVDTIHCKKFADELSRLFSSEDLAVRQTLWSSVVLGMMEPLDSISFR
jgi:hypothetical protein